LKGVGPSDSIKHRRTTAQEPHLQSGRRGKAVPISSISTVLADDRLWGPAPHSSPSPPPRRLLSSAYGKLPEPQLPATFGRSSIRKRVSSTTGAKVLPTWPIGASVEIYETVTQEPGDAGRRQGPVECLLGTGSNWRHRPEGAARSIGISWPPASVVPADRRRDSAGPLFSALRRIRVPFGTGSCQHAEH
jgi:hypothetical protein